MWRRIAEVAVLSALLFVALPFVVRALGGDFTNGVLMGTGAAIVWYTLETHDLRRETERLRQASSRQIEIMTEQQEAAVRPLVVARVEAHADGAWAHRTPGLPFLPTPYARFVLRNIGHGPALFVKVQTFTANVWTKGNWQLEVATVDLVEPGNKAGPLITPRFVDGSSQIPGYSEIVDSFTPGVHATSNYDVTITYEDVRKRRYESVTRMGRDEIRLMSHRLLA
jgi:hypothetical protein